MIVPFCFTRSQQIEIHKQRTFRPQSLRCGIDSPSREEVSRPSRLTHRAVTQDDNFSVLGLRHRYRQDEGRELGGEECAGVERTQGTGTGNERPTECDEMSVKI